MKNKEFLLNWKLLSAKFIDRPNRFLTRVRLDGKIVESHLPDPGRLKELLIPGVEVLIKEEENVRRKTRYTTQMVVKDNHLISLNTLMPNRLVKCLLKRHAIEQFSEWDLIQSEKTFGKSRFDFFLKKGIEKLILEVKSVTLVKDKIALFPDAITTRGSKHIKHLIQLAQDGYKTAILFVVQRNDANAFTPNYNCDPKFAKNLLLAFKMGVLIHIIKINVSKEKLVYTGKLPLKFDKIG